MRCGPSTIDEHFHSHFRSSGRQLHGLVPYPRRTTQRKTSIVFLPIVPICGALRKQVPRERCWRRWIHEIGDWDRQHSGTLLSLWVASPEALRTSQLAERGALLRGVVLR